MFFFWHRSMCSTNRKIRLRVRVIIGTQVCHDIQYMFFISVCKLLTTTVHTGVRFILTFLVKRNLQLLPYTSICICLICRTKVEVVQLSSSTSFPKVFFQASSVDCNAGGELSTSTDCIQQGNTSSYPQTAHWSGCLCLSPVASPLLALFLITWPPVSWSPMQLMTH